MKAIVLYVMKSFESVFAPYYSAKTAVLRRFHASTAGRAARKIGGFLLAKHAFPSEPKVITTVPRFGSFWLILAVVAAGSYRLYDPQHSLLNTTMTLLWSLYLPVAIVTHLGIRQSRKKARATIRYLKEHPDIFVAGTVLSIKIPSIGRQDVMGALLQTVRSAIEIAPRYFKFCRIDIVVDEGCFAETCPQLLELCGTRVVAHANGESSLTVRLLSVPESYATPNGTRKKARANQYAIERETSLHALRLHLDDDTSVTEGMLEHCALFARGAYNRSNGERAILGQGVLTYAFQNAVSATAHFADSIRAVDDFGRFSLFTGSGYPFAGLHGEWLLVWADVEEQIGWDFGPREITEDARFAMAVRENHPGLTVWFSTYCVGASPETVKDFVTQRQRWAAGLIGIALNKSEKKRSRVFIGLFTGTWVIGLFQHVFSVMALVAILNATGAIHSWNLSPTTPVGLAIWTFNFSSIIWSMIEGVRINALASGRPPLVRHYATVILGIPIYSFMEALGGTKGLWMFVKNWAANQLPEFIVVRKTLGEK